MKRKIEFYVPDDEPIPLIFRLMVDGKQVHYEEIKADEPERIAYKFYVYNDDIDEGMEIVKDIVRKMEWQSEEFGQSWRLVDLVFMEGGLTYNGYIATFRVRDSY